MKYMGIDHHKQYFIATVKDQEGTTLRKDRVSTDRAAIRHYFRKVNKDKDLKVVMEAGYGWEYLYDEIQGKVQEVKLAHPLKTRAIAEARIKTDSLDSDVLTHLLRTNLIAEAYALPYEVRDKRHILRYRISLLRIRTMLKNMIHAVLNRNHIEEPTFRDLSDKFGKKGKAYIKSFKLKGNDTKIVKGYLSLLEELDKKVEAVEKKIQKTFEEDDICKLLESIPGIGKLSSVLVRYEIGDIERFASARKLCSYAGLVPSTYSSGGKTYHGKITKQGNKWLRWIMTEIALRAVVKDAWIRSQHNKIKERGGAKKARTATARRLLEIIYKVWKERRPYYEKPLAVALEN